MSAISALKGFRTQFLYSLHYILSNQEANVKFRLEGIEDLDILDSNDNIIKVIQVKNLNTPLVLSDIHSQKETKTSFIKRYLETKRIHPNVEPMVVSFGSIGEELKNWKLSTSRKQETPLLKEYNWIEIKQKIVFVKVDEIQLEHSSIDILRKRYIAIDPRPTFDILLGWLFHIAEKQQIITARDLFDKVEIIAQYLSERIAITAQYGEYISALHLEDYTNLNFERLQEEFYNGVNSSYAHIIYNLDVERPELIKEINSGFESSNIVVLQGASGQGKSTLAYRYAFANTPSPLIYELNIQENPEKSREAILSIKSLIKSLETSILFLIHVSPNSTEWLKIIQEFAKDSIYFLVTIRQEDWYKAQSAGIKFLYKEVELKLLKAEASEIYSRLNEKNLDLIHLDFEEAWIQFGEQGPLLEFVHAVTKGKSLENTLKQQLSVLEKENHSSHQDLLTLLRLVCLADTYGARVSAEKVKGITNIHELIKRLEKEYLLKLTVDKKYITGLHPQRSTVLLRNLFDEFILEKKTFALEHIKTIEEKDTYFYILHLFDETGLVPNDLITSLQNDQTISWTFYYGVFKSLLWAGIDDYLKKNNDYLKQAYEQLGDTWTIFVGLYFGETSSVSNSFLDTGDLDDSFKKVAAEINKQLSPKDEAFTHVKALLTKIRLPSYTPQNSEDWSSYGQLAFWTEKLNQEDKTRIVFSKNDYEKAFDFLDAHALAILMFGLTWSGEYAINLKQEFTSKFTKKLRLRYNIPELKITHDEVLANYIIDITQGDDENYKALNERSMEILSLLRKAFPEKSKYSAQGYGHRLELVPLPYDDSYKTISAENLYLEEWVEINSITRKRFEYAFLPENWDDFFKQLKSWESNIKEIIEDYSKSFAAFYGGDREFKFLYPLINYVNYQNLLSLKGPKSLADSFGISFDKTSSQFGDRNPSGHIETKLNSKYKDFFVSQRDFRFLIEIFIKQSAETIHHKLKKLEEPEHALNENILRLSQTNLFDAIKQLIIYQTEKRNHFGKFIKDTDPVISEKQLLSFAFIWKQFSNNRFIKQNNISQKALAHINDLKRDFESRITKNCKTRSKKGDSVLRYHNDISTEHKAIIFVEIEEPIWVILGLKEAFEAIKSAIGQPDYTSLKYLILELHFSEFSIIPLVKGKTLNAQWHQIPLYAFHNNEFENLGTHHFLGKPISQEITQNFQLLDWSRLVSKISDTKHFLEQFMRMVMLNQHLLDMKELFDKDMDTIGENILADHFQKKGKEIQTSFQDIFDYINELLESYPYDEQLFISNELEREYWNRMIVFNENILPTETVDEGRYEFRLNMELIESWSKKLKICTEQIGVIHLLLYGKHIKEAIQFKL